MEVPNVKRNEFTLVDINPDDGFVTLMNDAGDTREDLKLPADGGDEIRKKFEGLPDDASLMVGVTYSRCYLW